ncbi:hypothetical protein MP228_000792 [Amoeboaphelidium protococcarum]|nr:hypothetical protein MP228_000792 [Amoeboaphelidium protococcarum]
MGEDIMHLFKWMNGKFAQDYVLHVDKETVLKEIRSIPSCDGMSCFYCKEWAQFIYKSFYNNSTSSNISQQSSSSGKRGNSGQSSHLLDAAQQKTDQSSLMVEFMCGRIEKYVRHDPFTQTKRVTSNPNGGEGGDNQPDSVVEMVEDLLKCYNQWMEKRPNAWKSQDVLKPLVLPTPHPDMNNHNGNVIKDRRNFEFLRTINQDKKGFRIKMSDLCKYQDLFVEESLTLKDYYCHDRATDTMPTEIEVEAAELDKRRLIIEKCIETDLKPKLKVQWQTIEDLIVFIRDNLKELELIVGADAIQKATSERCEQAHMPEHIPFDQYFQDFKQSLDVLASQNAQEALQKLDGYIMSYIDCFYEILADEGLFCDAERIGEKLQQFVSRFSDVFFSRVQKIDIPRSKELVEQIESEARSSVQNLSTITETRIREIIEDYQCKKEELLAEVDYLNDSYCGKSKASYLGRMERIGKKDFKKRVKRIEMMLQTLLKQFNSALINAFPSFYLVLVVYMIVKFFVYENTGRESDIISNAIAKRIEEVKKFLHDSSICKSKYLSGLSSGCVELSNVFVKVLHREMQKKYFDNKALEAQNELLRSLEAEQEQKTASKKKSNSSSAANSKKGNPQQASTQMEPLPSSSLKKPFESQNIKGGSNSNDSVGKTAVDNPAATSVKNTSVPSTQPAQTKRNAASTQAVSSTQVSPNSKKDQNAQPALSPSGQPQSSKSKKTQQQSQRQPQSNSENVTDTRKITPPTSPPLASTANQTTAVIASPSEPMVEERKYTELLQQFNLLQGQMQSQIVTLSAFEHRVQDADRKNGELIELCKGKDMEISHLWARIFDLEQKVVEVQCLNEKLKKEVEEATAKTLTLEASLQQKEDQQLLSLTELQKSMSVPGDHTSTSLKSADGNFGSNLMPKRVNSRASVAVCSAGDSINAGGDGFGYWKGSSQPLKPSSSFGNNPFTDSNMQTAQSLLSELNQELRTMFVADDVPAPQSTSSGKIGRTESAPSLLPQTPLSAPGSSVLGGSSGSLFGFDIWNPLSQPSTGSSVVASMPNATAGKATGSKAKPMKKSGYNAGKK